MRRLSFFDGDQYQQENNTSQKKKRPDQMRALSRHHLDFDISAVALAAHNGKMRGSDAVAAQNSAVKANTCHKSVIGKKGNAFQLREFAPSILHIEPFFFSLMDCNFLNTVINDQPLAAKRRICRRGEKQEKAENQYKSFFHIKL